MLRILFLLGWEKKNMRKGIEAIRGKNREEGEKGKWEGGGGVKKINEKQKDRNVVIRTKFDNVNGTRDQMNINNDIYCIPNG
jgi:hypothetical protein